MHNKFRERRLSIAQRYPHLANQDFSMGKSSAAAETLKRRLNHCAGASIDSGSLEILATEAIAELTVAIDENAKLQTRIENLERLVATINADRLASEKLLSELSSSATPSLRFSS